MWRKKAYQPKMSIVMKINGNVNNRLSVSAMAIFILINGVAAENIGLARLAYRRKATENIIN
jgi:hypothetical protein